MIDSCFKDVRICTTRPLPRPHFPPGIPVEEAISLNGQTWNVGDTIGIGFLNGTQQQRYKAQKYIENWLEVVNLHFDFNAPRPDCRITFTPGGSWSYIGTGCRSVLSGPTMQFGWVTDSSDEVSDRAVILHESGHMIGLGHEQSNPLMDLKINVPLTVQYFMTTQGWTEQMVEDNVLHVFDPSEITGTAYDRSSIMQYAFPDQLTLDGRGVGWNTMLSLLDRVYGAILYPGAVAPPVQPPIVVVPPIVVPPILPPVQPSIPDIIIGGPSVSVRIPNTGDPALFNLVIPNSGAYNLTIVVNPSYGQIPVARVVLPGDVHPRLPLRNNQVKYRFDTGNYKIGVWNPSPRQKGTASIKARHAPM